MATIKRNLNGEQSLTDLRARFKESVNKRMENDNGNWVISDQFGSQKYPMRYNEREVLQLFLFGKAESKQDARDMIGFQKHLSF